MKLLNEGNLLLAIARNSIDPEPDRTGITANISNIDWSEFKKLMIYHELHTFVYPLVKDHDSLLPQDSLRFFKVNYYASIVRSQQLWQEYLRIFDAFEASGVDIVPIKGIAFLADVYAQKPVRTMTDIDVLVKEEELDKAKLVFEGLGYKQGYGEEEEKYWITKQCHVLFSRRQSDKSNFLVDVHFALDFKRHNRNILPRVWDRVVTVNSDGRVIKLLAPEDTLFSLALHERRFGKALCLKNVFDLVSLLNKYRKDFDWDYVLREAAAGKMSASTYFILFQANTLFGAIVPEYALNSLNISAIKKKLIRDFVLKNTFSPGIGSNGKALYLKSHFLLYDSFIEPAGYIVNIPLEQFAKYYSLPAQAKRTRVLHRFRLFFIPWNYITNKLNTRP